MRNYFKYLLLPVLLFFSVDGLTQKGEWDIVHQYRDLRSLESGYTYVTRGGKMDEQYQYYNTDSVKDTFLR